MHACITDTHPSGTAAFEAHRGLTNVYGVLLCSVLTAGTRNRQWDDGPKVDINETVRNKSTKSVSIRVVLKEFWEPEGHVARW
ncbi:hypothetical protein EG68_00296 [Paragonimus skrjabini miyazakii]|uniref:Uncharacterized protein n=1 Tax=Paragonimus skrjabini miyazakii TaxID=59628 RepID=A0A8S9Z698_9TREM|nr:hypothetical protein EG68_00296 [Paragonimus skrjabini miyazakii]